MSYTTLWIIHAVLMGTSVTALSSGILISHFYYKRKWRYKTHRRLGITAGITGTSGLILAVTLVLQGCF